MGGEKLNTYNWKYNFARIVDGYAEGFEYLDLRIVPVRTC